MIMNNKKELINMRIKKAFTMAEAILVMTILGIIATIMITTLKPAEYKDKGLAIMARKVLSEIDTATTQILINNSASGNTSSLYEPGTANLFSLESSGMDDKIGKLYKRYLTVTRQECNDANCPCNGYTNKFYLKDGACMGITTGTQASDVNTWFPGETNFTSMKPTHGIIFFDTNGEDEPNVMGKDQFLLPVGSEGVQYATD